MNMRKKQSHPPLLALLMAVVSQSAVAQQDVGTAFTYQGTLESNGIPVTGVPCDLRFGLWDDGAAGNQISSSPQTITGVAVEGGVFTVTIDFGASALNGQARWLEIEVQCAGDVGFTMLSPRVELTPTPHAVRAVEGVGGPNGLHVSSAGNVGIGATNPATSLHLAKANPAIRLQDTAHVATENTLSGFFSVHDAGDTQVMWAGDGSSGNNYFTIRNNYGGFEVFTGSAGVASSRMLVDPSGNVGIGTTSPGARLHAAATVTTATPPLFRATDDSAAGGFLNVTDGTTNAGQFLPTIWGKAIGTGTARAGLTLFGEPGEDQSDDPGVGIEGRLNGVALVNSPVLRVTNLNAELFRIGANGNVGIGTTSPAEKLHVAGNVQVDGMVTTAGRTRRLFVPVTDFVFTDGTGSSVKNTTGDSTGYYVVTRVTGVSGNYRYWHWHAQLPEDLKTDTVTIGHVAMGTDVSGDTGISIAGWVSSFDAADTVPSNGTSNVFGWNTMVSGITLTNNVILEASRSFTHAKIAPGNYLVVRAEFLSGLNADAELIGAYIEYTGE